MQYSRNIKTQNGLKSSFAEHAKKKGSALTMVLTVAALLCSKPIFADPVIFGMELGKTTESELKSIYNVERTGVNKYSSGNMYSVPVSSIQFDGLQGVKAIFDHKGVLVAVLTDFPKSKFDYLNQVVGGKYTRVSQNIPFVGNKSATYRDGGTEITLSAPHMSFTMTMNYIRDEFMRAFNELSATEKREKERNESSQL